MFMFNIVNSSLFTLIILIIVTVSRTLKLGCDDDEHVHGCQVDFTQVLGSIYFL